MPGKLIVAPNYVEFEGCLIYLGGPIQGSKNWQAEAIRITQNHASDVNIASPRREYLPGEFVYAKQVDWETHYLREAAKKGAVLFWLAKEFEHSCDRAYAQTTRFEVGEWKVRHEVDNVRFVLGIEEGFTGARYMRRRFSQDCPKIKIFDSLEDTCIEAIKEARSV